MKIIRSLTTAFLLFLAIISASCSSSEKAQDKYLLLTEDYKIVEFAGDRKISAYRAISVSEPRKLMFLTFSWDIEPPFKKGDTIKAKIIKHMVYTGTGEPDYQLYGPCIINYGERTAYYDRIMVWTVLTAEKADAEKKEER